MARTKRKSRIFRGSKKSIALLLIVTALGVGLYYVFLQPDNLSVKDTGVDTKEDTYLNLNPPSEQEKEEADAAKRARLEQSDSQTASADTQKVAISSAVQEGSNLVIKTQLPGTGWEKCTLTLSQGPSKITKTAEVLYQSDFSTCMGFEVSVNELPSAGNWLVSLNVLRSDGQNAQADNKTVRIVK